MYGGREGGKSDRECSKFHLCMPRPLFYNAIMLIRLTRLFSFYIDRVRAAHIKPVT